MRLLLSCLGLKETCNELAKELGGYTNVTVAHDIKVVDEGTSHAFQNLPLGTVPCDLKFGNTKGNRRLCLITSAQHPLRDPPEGTKEDQVDTIADQIKRHDIRMDCIVFRDPEVHHNSVMELNDRLLQQFRNRAVAKVVQVDSPTSLLGALKTRTVLPVTLFRGDLEVSSNFKIKVCVYKKTYEEKFPTLKKYSDKAPPSDKFASHEVKVDYKYKSIFEPDKIIPPDQRIKGYLYGPQVVPISSAVKFKPEKGVKLLGFTDRYNILRHYFMKDVCSFIPEPGNTKATLAVSAVARATQLTNKVAIVGCVWRQGQGKFAFGVLTPNISSVKNVPDSFYFNALPFAEDIREFQFRSFNSLPPSSRPTDEQQEAADNLVKMLDLAPPGREILKPEFTPNPMLERFYNFLNLKAKQPDASVTLVDTCLGRITEPYPGVVDHQRLLIQSMGKTFDLKNPKKKKARTQDRLAYTGADDQAKLLEQPSADEALYPPTQNPGKIGDLNPVQDFEAILAERSSPTWVQKAIEEMQKHTLALLENSVEGDNYQKALECFVALRKACIIEQEPQEFNQFLTKTYGRFRKGGSADFFKLLSEKNISLISNEEAPDSEKTTDHVVNLMGPMEILTSIEGRDALPSDEHEHTQILGLTMSLQENLNTTTTKMLVEHACKKIGMRVEDFYAVYNGKPLADMKILANTTVFRNSTIQIRPRLRGGRTQRLTKANSRRAYGVFLSEYARWAIRKLFISLVEFDDSLEEVQFNEETCKNDYTAIADALKSRLKISKTHGFPLYVTHLLKYLRECPAGANSNKEAPIAFLTSHPAIVEYTDRIAHCTVLCSMVTRLDGLDCQDFHKNVRQLPVGPHGETLVVYGTNIIGCLMYARNFLKHGGWQFLMEELEAAFSVHLEAFLPQLLEDIAVKCEARSAFNLAWQPCR
ncbi:hypothetical protein ACP4OV_001879 [Aristida adscensionis]